MDKQVVADGPFAAIIPDGVRVAETIHLSGAVSVDGTGTPLHEGDFLAQNREAYAQIAATLAKFDAGLGNVVKETVFVTDVSMPMGDPDAPWQAYAGMRDEIYGGRVRRGRAVSRAGGGAGHARAARGDRGRRARLARPGPRERAPAPAA